MSVVEMKVPTIGESITEVTPVSMVKERWWFCQHRWAHLWVWIRQSHPGVSGRSEWQTDPCYKEGDDLSIGTLVARIDTSVQNTVTAATPEVAKAAKVDQ